MSNDKQVTDFIQWMSLVRAVFGEAHISAERSPQIAAVTTEVIPASDSGGESLAISLLAELRQPADPEKQAVGIALQLRLADGKWLADAELGWSGREIGWDIVEEQNLASGSLEHVMEKAWSSQGG